MKEILCSFAILIPATILIWVVASAFQTPINYMVGGLGMFGLIRVLSMNYDER